MTVATTSGASSGATAVPSLRASETGPRATPKPVRCSRKAVSSLRTSASEGGRELLGTLVVSVGGAWPGGTATTTLGCDLSGSAGGAGFAEAAGTCAAAGLDAAVAAGRSLLPPSRISAAAAVAQRAATAAAIFRRGGGGGAALTPGS